MTPAVRIDDVDLRIGGHRILDGVVLEVLPGARHLVSGPNGAGKTSLLGVIAGTIRPTRGAVWWNGADITRWPPSRRARQGLARTRQQPSVWTDLTVADNLRLVAPSVPVSDLLARADLSAHGVRPAGELSYGKRRTLEIAMALAQRPTLLLLDEPSAGLSRSERAALVERLRDLEPDVTVLIVDHDEGLYSGLATHMTGLHMGRVGRVGRTGQARPVPPALRAAEAPTKPPDVGLRPALSVQDLRVSRSGTLVVEGFDFEAYPGRRVDLVGVNGAGKTTLLAALAGLVPIEAGKIVLSGDSIERRSAVARSRAGLAAVIQGHDVFPGLTVHEQATITSVRPAALEIFPGLPAVWRQRAETLSGGQQRMAAMAIALGTQPRVLLLDEPFEGLAPDSAISLERALRSAMAAGVAVIVTAHEPAPPSQEVTQTIWLNPSESL